MTIEEILAKHEIKDLDELEKILNDCDNVAEDAIQMMAVSVAYTEYCKSIGKEKEAKEFVKNFVRNLGENKDEPSK